MHALRHHVDALAPAPQGDDVLSPSARLGDGWEMNEGDAPPDHGLQAGVEPARSHPQLLEDYLANLRACKMKHIQMIKTLWVRHGGPLKTPVQDEESVWDMFLLASRELRMEFQAACTGCLARVVGVFHEDALLETEDGEGDADAENPDV